MSTQTGHGIFRRTVPKFAGAWYQNFSHYHPPKFYAWKTPLKMLIPTYWFHHACVRGKAEYGMWGIYLTFVLGLYFLSDKRFKQPKELPQEVHNDSRFYLPRGAPELQKLLTQS